MKLSKMRILEFERIYSLSTFLQALIQGIGWGGIYTLIASGLTMVYAVSRVLNFAHGDLLALALYLSFFLYTIFGMDPYVSFFLTIPSLIGIGLLQFFLMRSILYANTLMVIQLTLAFVFIIEDGLRLIFTSNYRTIPSIFSGSRFFIGEIVVTTPFLIAMVSSFPIAIGFYFILQRTQFGRAVRGISERPTTAALMGINVKRTQLIIFVWGIALLGVVGPLLAPIMVLEPYMGLHITLMGFIILVVGGAGNFLGALIGGLTIGVAESLGNLYLGSDLAPAIPYAVFVVILLVRPQGILRGV